MKNDGDCKYGFGRRRPAQAEGEAPSAARRCEAYFRRKYSGGRSAFARVVDYIVLRLIVFVCAYLFFAPKFEKRGTAFLLAAIALGIAMLVLRLAREIAFDRFVGRETARIRKILLQDKLLLADVQTVAGLAGGLCPMSERAVVLQRALAVDADALLSLVRSHRGYGRLHVFSCTAFDRTATEFAMRANGMLLLHEPEELMKAASKAGMSPPQEAVYAFIETEQQNYRKQRRRQRQRFSPFAAVSAKKYLFTALILIGASFLTRYTLYYRMLAGLCVTIAACSAALTRQARTLPDANNIG